MTPEEHAHDLLGRYATGKLDEGEVDRFRQHLENCGECQAEKAFLDEVATQIARHGEAFLEEHPAPARLVAFVRGELAEMDGGTVRRHLDLCRTCSAEARWVSGEAVLGSPAAPGRGLEWRAWYRAAGAAAAAAIVVAVVLSVLREPSGGGASFYAPQFVARPERGEGRPSSVIVERGQLRWSSYFPIDVEAGSLPCVVELVDRSGRTLARKSVTSLDDLVQGQYLSLDCSRAVCPPGAYAVRITSAPAGGQVLETIPFEVVER